MQQKLQRPSGSETGEWKQPERNSSERSKEFGWELWEANQVTFW